jgi:hypothetical protein
MDQFEIADELRDILRKINECERMANVRIQDESQRNDQPKEFYEGQACAYRNSAHYIERIVNFLDLPKGR